MDRKCAPKTTMHLKYGYIIKFGIEKQRLTNILYFENIDATSLKTAANAEIQNHVY